MQIVDLHTVNVMMSNSFSRGRKDDGYENTHIPLCRQDFLEMYLAECPDGCLVLEENNEILAVSFCHVWGNTGWIGPLAVSFEQHLNGLGTKILLESLKYLKYAGCKTIGLETNPRSNRNLGFYGKCGFEVDSLCADIIRPTLYNTNDVHPSPYKIVCFSECFQDQRQVFLGLLKKLTHFINSGLDFAPLVNSLANYNFGDSVLFLHEKAPIAFAAFQTKATSVEEENYILRNIVFLAHPRIPVSHLEFFINDLSTLARNRDLEQLLLRIQLANTQVFQQFMQLNFKIIHTDQRMTLSGYSEKIQAGSFYFSRWV